MTININELRRKLRSGDIVDHIDIRANVNPILTELLDRLEAAEKERAVDEQRIADLMEELNRVGHENDALRARIEAMERQEPVASVWRCDNGHIHGSCERTLPMGAKLYLAPGAKGEEK